MIIEDRLFSENTEEVLYSVLMDEEELALFSEFQKEFGKVGKLISRPTKRPVPFKPDPKLKEAIKVAQEKYNRNIGLFK